MPENVAYYSGHRFAGPEPLGERFADYGDRNRLGFAEESAGAQRGAAGGKVAGRDATDQRHRPLHRDSGRIVVRNVEYRLAGNGSAGIGGEASDSTSSLNAGQRLNMLDQFTKKGYAARAGRITRIE